jgi:signal transduction histidine kinase
MVRVLGCITDQHDIRLVVLAGVICFLACYTAFSLLNHSQSPHRRTRLAWLAGAAAVTGTGIWSTHFVAMLAFRPGLPLGYDLELTLFSVAIAVATSGIGFLIADKSVEDGGLLRAALGGAIVGAGIGAMHFTGMAALTVAGLKHWDSAYAHASLVIGMVMGAAALALATSRRDVAGRLAATGLLTLGICGLHFTAMAAFIIEPDPRVLVSDSVLEPEWLAVAVAAITILIIALGLAGSIVDEHLAQRSADEAHRLRQHVAALEATQRELRETTRQLEAAFEAAAAGSQAKSQFLATMSHELRTPLNSIIGFSEFAANEIYGPLDPRYRESAQNVLDSGRHLLGIINDVLDFSKVEAGRLELREEGTDLAALVGAALRFVSPQAEDLRIEIGSEMPPSPPLVMADPQRLRQVLLNLLSNAIKFTPPGGSVQVSVWQDDAGVSLAISDTGIGMSAEQIPSALQRFVQIDSDLGRKRGGTGLGLPLSKRLIELHGGELRIASVLGAGTTVTVTLPLRRLIASEASLSLASD